MNYKKQALIITLTMMTLANTFVTINAMKREMTPEQDIQGVIGYNLIDRVEQLLNQYPYLLNLKFESPPYDSLLSYALYVRRTRIARMLAEKGAEISPVSINIIDEKIKDSINSTEKSNWENLRSYFLDQMQKQQREKQQMQQKTEFKRIIEQQKTYPAEESYEYLKSLGREKKI